MYREIKTEILNNRSLIRLIPIVQLARISEIKEILIDKYQNMTKDS